MIRGLNSDRGKRFFVLQDVRRGSGPHPTSYSMGNGFLFGDRAAGAWR